MPFLRKERHAHRLQAALQQLAALGVTRPGILEALVEYDSEAGVEAVDHRDRGSVGDRPERLRR
jgi:hypothetical protein